MKLSECKNGDMFYYNKKVVVYQYILKQIYNGICIDDIMMYSNKKQLYKHMSPFSKINNSKLDMVKVDVDISKDNIKQIDEDGFKFEITSESHLI